MNSREATKFVCKMSGNVRKCPGMSGFFYDSIIIKNSKRRLLVFSLFFHLGFKRQRDGCITRLFVLDRNRVRLCDARVNSRLKSGAGAAVNIIKRSR